MLQRLGVIAACAAVAAQLLRASWDATVCVEPGDEIPQLEAPRGDGCWVAVNATIGAKWATGYLGACAAQDVDINAATPWTLHCAAVASCRWHARRRGDELAVCSGDLCGNQIYGAFVLNRRVDPHAIERTRRKSDFHTDHHHRPPTRRRAAARATDNSTRPRSAASRASPL